MNDLETRYTQTPTQTQTADEPASLKFLALAAILTVLAWRLPNGNYLVYPFTILATWFHEMGHGLTAMLTGGQFQKLEMFPDGSGVATSLVSVDGGLSSRLSNAAIAAGGLLGPAVAGAVFIYSSRRYSTAHWTLVVLGAFILLSVLIWVRSAFGLVAMGLWGAAILGIGLKGSRWLQSFAIQLLGVQACLSTFHQLDYLFSDNANIGGQLMPSDSGQIAQNLWLPYWFWGGLIALLSAVLLLGSLYATYRPQRKTSITD
jgi:hypothetical protein